MLAARALGEDTGQINGEELNAAVMFLDSLDPGSVYSVLTQVHAVMVKFHEVLGTTGDVPLTEVWTIHPHSRTSARKPS